MPSVMKAARRVDELAARIRDHIAADDSVPMPTLKSKAAERTTIKVEAAAAKRIRQIAWIEQVSTTELYSRILTEWAAGYEAALGKKIDEVLPGHVNPSTKAGKTVGALRAPKPED